MEVILWRAAPSESPHFGKGSYWTVSSAFAAWFGHWLSDTYGGTYALYRADVEVDQLLDIPFPRTVPSDVITSLVDEFAALGHQWVRFHEGTVEGKIVPQYVYLGKTPIATRRV